MKDIVAARDLEPGMVYKRASHITWHVCLAAQLDERDELFMDVTILRSDGTIDARLYYVDATVEVISTERNLVK